MNIPIFFFFFLNLKKNLKKNCSFRTHTAGKPPTRIFLRLALYGCNMNSIILTDVYVPIRFLETMNDGILCKQEHLRTWK